MCFCVNHNLAWVVCLIGVGYIYLLIPLQISNLSSKKIFAKEFTAETLRSFDWENLVGECELAAPLVTWALRAMFPSDEAVSRKHVMGCKEIRR